MLTVYGSPRSSRNAGFKQTFKQIHQPRNEFNVFYINNGTSTARNNQALI